MKFTSLFIENFVLEMGLGGLGSFFPSLTTISGAAIQVVGSLTSTYSNSLNDIDNSSLVPTSVLSTGSIVYDIGGDISDAGVDAYKKTLDQLNTTEAYMESLNYEELEDMIAKLESKEIKLSLNEDKCKQEISNNNEKQLINIKNKRI